MERHTRSMCPRCQAGRLRRWHDLRPEEQELVRRLPMSADYDLATRQQTHRWCRRCWHETPDNTLTLA